MQMSDTRQDDLTTAVADAIQVALIDAENAYWYRRKVSKIGYEVIHTQPNEYQVAGAGVVLVNRKHAEAARHYTNRMRAIFIADAAIDAMQEFSCPR